MSIYDLYSTTLLTMLSYFLHACSVIVGVSHAYGTVFINKNNL